MCVSRIISMPRLTRKPCQLWVGGCGGWVKKFHIYVYRRRFTVVTDHKPLTFIFHPPNKYPRWRSKFRFCRRAVASLMVGSIIDLLPKPKCLINLIDLRFQILNNRIPHPNPKPNPYPYQNGINVKYVKKSLTNFKIKKPHLGFEPCLLC